MRWHATSFMPIHRQIAWIDGLITYMLENQIWCVAMWLALKFDYDAT